jgi:carbon storage regulator
MLVLSRKPGQKIEIDSEIVITVVEIKGKRVTIGIEAPDHVRIRRVELPEPTPVLMDPGCNGVRQSLQADLDLVQ